MIWRSVEVIVFHTAHACLDKSIRYFYNRFVFNGDAEGRGTQLGLAAYMRRGSFQNDAPTSIRSTP